MYSFGTRRDIYSQKRTINGGKFDVFEGRMVVGMKIMCIFASSK